MCCSSFQLELLSVRKNNSFLFVFSCIGVDLEPSQAPSHYKGKICGLLEKEKDSKSLIFCPSVSQPSPFYFRMSDTPLKSYLKSTLEQLVLTLNKNGPTTKGLMNKNVQSQTFRSLQRALEGGGR
jgi:hypothetical protein